MSSSCIVMAKIPTRNLSYYFYSGSGIEVYLLRALYKIGFKNRKVTIKSLYYIRGASNLEYYSYFLYEIDGISTGEMESAIRNNYSYLGKNSPCELILMYGGDTYYKYVISQNITIKEKANIDKKLTITLTLSNIKKYEKSILKHEELL